MAATAPKSRRRAAVRAVLKWVRVVLLLALFLAISAVVYFTTIGLPDFLKRPLVARLKQEGFDVQFQQVRWHWFRGLVIEQAVISPTETRDAITLTAGEAVLDLRLPFRKNEALQFRSLRLRDGRLTLASPGETPLALDDVQASLDFSNSDRLHIEKLKAVFGGIQFQVAGELAHISTLRKIKPESTSSTNTLQATLRDVAEVLQRLKFEARPEVTIQFQADLQEPAQTQIDWQLNAPGNSVTPWGQFCDLTAQASTTGAPAESLNGKLRLSVREATTPWGSAENFRLETLMKPDEPGRMRGDFHFAGDQLKAGLTHGLHRVAADIAMAQVTGNAVVSTKNFAVHFAEGRAQLDRAAIRQQSGEQSPPSQGVLQEGNFSFAYDPAAAAAGMTEQAQEALGWVWPLLAWSFQRGADFKEIKTPQVPVDALSLSGSWRAPRLAVASARAKLFDGSLRCAGELDATTRAAAVSLESDFDPHRIAPLLSPGGKRFLDQFTWEEPPRIEAELAAVLPPWTDPESDWRAEVVPTLSINGSFSTKEAGYRGVTVLSAESSLNYSNRVWRLENFRVVRPEGELRLALTSHEETQEYRCRIDGPIDPLAVRHLLDEDHQRAFEIVQFTKAPRLRGTVEGKWRDYDHLRFDLVVEAEDFVARDVPVQRLDTRAAYTNQILTLTDMAVKQGGKDLFAPRMRLDFERDRIFFEEIKSALDPHRVAHIIGRQALEAIEPYRFTNLHQVDLSGSIGLSHGDEADLLFFIRGEGFRWEWYEADAVTAWLHWHGKAITVTNIQAQAYKGRMEGSAAFDFRTKGKSDYRFDLAFADLDAQTLLQSVNNTNQLEGLLSGQLNIASADTRGLHTWNGSGEIRLRDGLIWKIPIFGIFSPMLDALVPGLGKSRAREASATFAITNGVAHSEDMEIRASTVRMQYRGTVDHEQRVDARVEAEILRDMKVIGRVVSLALSPLTKLFEFKVTGTVDQPKMEPLYIPKFLMAPLRPFHTIKQLFPEKSAETPGDPVEKSQ